MQLLLCSTVIQNSQILYWVSVMFVVSCFWVDVVKNGLGLLDHRTLKLAISQESELIKWTVFLARWYTFRKANANLVIIGWAWPKMGKTFRLYIVVQNQLHLTYDLINQADWFNNVSFDHQSTLYLWHLLGVHCSCTC